MRLNYLTSAASTYNGVWFKSHGAARPPSGDPPETPCVLKQRGEQFRGAAR